MMARHRAAVIGMLIGTAAGLALAGPAAADPGDPIAPTVSAESAEQQAALVAAEDKRLDQVRAVSAVAALSGTSWNKPYRLGTADGYTLVLTQRREPYTVADLLKLGPQTFVRQADGSYLLTENIYLNSGAKLTLSNPGGLTVRMASTANAFVSIVSFGGDLKIVGTPQAPTKVISWDKRTSLPDTRVDDGRAYIRAIGGQFDASYAQISDLGFWSGRTGGVSLTGTDRPSTADVEGPAKLSKTEKAQAKAAEKAETPTPGAGDVFAQPTGKLAVPDSRFDIPGLSYVSGSVRHATITGNTFGLFVSGSNGVTITDTTVEKSLQDGVVLHRFADGIDVERLTSRYNGGDGFVLSRAAQQVRVSDSVAQANGNNGFTVNGLPLADGPSASGERVGSFGSNTIANSISRGNGRYGIEVIGGRNISLQNNTVIGGDMGIVARQGTNGVSISGNKLTGQTRQGIAVRDHVAHAVITGNIVTGADNAIYINKSVAEVRGNTVVGATNHGVSLVGPTAGSSVSYNMIAGTGPSALDTSRAVGKARIEQNQITAWNDTSSFWIKFRHYASPMTLLWVGIILLIIGSAIMGVRRRRSGVVGPYANTQPLTPPAVRVVARAAVRAGSFR
jgi:nitrous oxidase accessory protein NosD